MNQEGQTAIDLTTVCLLKLSNFLYSTLTSLTPPSHLPHTSLTPPSHLHHTSLTPPSHLHHTSITPPSHHPHTTLTPPSQHPHQTLIPTKPLTSPPPHSHLYTTFHPTSYHTSPRKPHHTPSYPTNLLYLSTQAEDVRALIEDAMPSSHQVTSSITSTITSATTSGDHKPSKDCPPRKLVIVLKFHILYNKH